MTLIIGIKCKNGYVLGADGAATYGIMGQHTIRQPVKKKLYLVGNNAVVGVSGAVGIGQRFRAEVEAVRNLGITIDGKSKQLSAAKPSEVMLVLRNALWGIVRI
jgi:hypothetical protein